jgi:hypothetical protein
MHIGFQAFVPSMTYAAYSAIRMRVWSRSFGDADTAVFVDRTIMLRLSSGPIGLLQSKASLRAERRPETSSFVEAASSIGSISQCSSPDTSTNVEVSV